MGMVVRTNTMALNAYRQLGMNNSAVSKSLEKLASGYRINRAGDDAAGLAISEKMKAQIKGLETASANAQDGISLIQTAEGNLGEVHDMLNRMVELATKSANGTYTSTERDALQAEVKQLLEEIDRISQSANFNGAKLLDGTMGLNNEAFTISEGAKYSAGGKTAIPASSFVTAADHINTSTATAQKPEFQVDFGEVSFTASPKVDGTAGNVNFKFTIGGQSVQIIGTDGNAITDVTSTDTNNLVVTSATNAGTDLAGSAIANHLTGKHVKIGDSVYEVTASTAPGADNAKVKFEWKGIYKAGETNGIDTTKTGDADIPTDWIPRGALTVEAVPDADATVANTDGTGRIDCNVTMVKDPVSAGSAVRAGIGLKLTKEMLANGNTLKIGDKTFTFDTSADPVNDTGTTIGLKGVSEDKLVEKALEQLSHKSVTIKDSTNTAKTFTIHVTADTLEIEEQSVGSTNYGKFTEAQLKDAFEFSKASANASTKLTVDFDKLVDGDKIVVGENTITVSKKDTADATITDLISKIGSSAKVDPADSNTIIIEAAAGVKDAPVIAGAGLTLQIGDTADTFNKMTVSVPNMSAKGLGLESLTVANQTSAATAINDIKDAINQVSTVRANMGALQNRLEHTINNLDVAAENLSAANSRIRDTDMAKEMMNYTKMNVLVQSAQAMLAQANQQPQSVLQLLQ